LQPKALAIYGRLQAEAWARETPINRMLVAAGKLLQNNGFRRCSNPLSRIQSARSLEKVKLKDEAVEAILINEESKKRYNSLALQVNQLYKAVLPDERANEFNSSRTLIMIIFETIRSLSPEVDISDVIGNIERLLDRSIASEGYVIDKLVEEHLVDLSKIDFRKNDLREEPQANDSGTAEGSNRRN
jgi:type I restriction enzyme R subunit